MPTDPTLVFEKRIKANKSEATDLRAALLLIPLALCLFSILLAVEYPAFAAAVTMMGAD